MTNPSLLPSKDPCIQFPYLTILLHKDGAGLPHVLPELEPKERHIDMKSIKFESHPGDLRLCYLGRECVLDIYLNVQLAYGSNF